MLTIVAVSPVTEKVVVGVVELLGLTGSYIEENIRDFIMGKKRGKRKKWENGGKKRSEIVRTGNDHHKRNCYFTSKERVKAA
jgi:hypothetical protein